jgi:hypothetical protein
VDLPELPTGVLMFADLTVEENWQLWLKLAHADTRYAKLRTYLTSIGAPLTITEQLGGFIGELLDLQLDLSRAMGLYDA